MTINEIERKIHTLNKLLENEKRKAEVKKDLYIGKYYKVADSCTLFSSIGKVIDLYISSDTYDYICDELYFDEDYEEFRNESSEYRKFKELEFITKEEFDELLEIMITKLKKKI